MSTVKSFFEFAVKDLRGKDFNLAAHKGSVVVVVNGVYIYRYL